LGNKNHKTNKKRPLYINTFRVIGSLLVIYIVYRYFYSDLRIKELWENTEQIFTTSSILPLAVILLLMPLNWLLEALKWREGLKPVHTLNIKQSFMSVFQGITLGIITPARVGEYGGRILYLDAKHRIPGVASTFICSIYQNLINILMASLVLILPFGSASFVADNYDLITSIGVIVSFVAAAILLFLPQLMQVLNNVNWLKAKIPQLSIAVTQLQQIKRRKIFTLSILRYMTYIAQYVLILQIFHLDFTVFDTVLAIAIIYGIQTVLPLTPLLQVGLRGSIALYVFSPSVVDESKIILGSYGLWMLNVLIPSVCGGILMVLKRK